ncbi:MULTISPECIES: hypothetical protein [Caproicibacterium]|uniref:Uncharacterized protein n=1 Tax=Caproicibacterium lactatifermentans TaxID=2666138 RepID=A0A859DMY4_9FIRM|nr:hypothetical protein [Caproicibacterium lactatifermentans]ARP49512.1 hypothetical protein B6259_00540 [Ruminococcaceae bacterium CPB6]MDD4806911.1 hypothetical protein [Oscillospiraceae bacterium]QKN23100.1 hypothetical protein GJQ69_00520 [Caproicibacterium lactatifermentans]
MSKSSASASKTLSASSKKADAAAGIALPSVGAVSEENPFANPVSDASRNTAVNGVGIALWVAVVTASVLIILLLRRNRRRKKGQTIEFLQHRPGRGGKKKHLLADKYYQNDFSHLHLDS